ncbi:hypothetical protein TIFTF001_016824 [Ficus carica]|uniref:RING-type domain-containing protein n=1 Tax=Ficus carica TaxID=3494 RepID=A0AA88D942_FICCA|nr:hypothetical protein TIFTF001_016824 [Ficus carica]
MLIILNNDYSDALNMRILMLSFLCYICLVEYEEGDRMRILPCHHEFHKTCVDKWLKEIHRRNGLNWLKYNSAAAAGTRRARVVEREGKGYWLFKISGKPTPTAGNRSNRPENTDRRRSVNRSAEAMGGSVVGMRYGTRSRTETDRMISLFSFSYGCHAKEKGAVAEEL